MLVSLATICRHNAPLLDVADITTQQAASNSPEGHYGLAFFCDIAQRCCIRGVDYIGCNARSELHSYSDQHGQRTTYCSQVLET